MHRVFRLLGVLVPSLLVLTAGSTIKSDVEVFKGDVVAIAEDSFTVEQENDEGDVIEKTFFITENTKFYAEGEPVGKDRLEEYDFVTVQYSETDGKLVAIEVTIEVE